MAATYACLNVHVAFATKDRQPTIPDEWRPRLHAYMGGTLRGLGATPLAIGGVADHVHLLVSLKTTHAVADLVRETKKAATDWMRNEADVRAFRWQEGYAALSVGEVNPVVAYIGARKSTTGSGVPPTSTRPFARSWRRSRSALL